MEDRRTLVADSRMNTEPFEQATRPASTLPSSPTITSPSPDLLAILRLYLERYPELAEEDRRLYRRVVAQLANPVLVAARDDARDDGLEYVRRTEPVSVGDKERADCNFACLLHLVGMVERGDVAGAKSYAEYVRAMGRMIEREDKRDGGKQDEQE